MDSYESSNFLCNKLKNSKNANKNIKKSKNPKEKINEENMKQKENSIKQNKNEINEIIQKTDNIRILSYNSRGFDMIKQKLCLELMEEAESEESMVPILCNQENFVLKGNSHLIRKAMKNYHVYIKPAKKNNLEGRPINGMFIALPKHLRSKSKDISPLNDRIQAVLLQTNEGKIMIINVYFPSDPKTAAYKTDSELEEVLIAIETLIHNHQCNKVVMVGDMNTDYKRKNGRVERYDKFLTDNSLADAWKQFDVDYTHEFENDGVTYFSTIDHIVWNNGLEKRVKTAGVLHRVGNTSDHIPIYCDIQLSSSYENKSTESRRKTVNTHAFEETDWQKFNEELDYRLTKVQVPECIECKDVHCKSVHHRKQIDDYTQDVLDTIDLAIKGVASTKRQNHTAAKVVPGWSDLVKPFCDDAKFWHAIWTSANKPLNTELHHIMKRTRNRYHYALRKCKRAAEHIKRDKLVKSCATTGNDIFDELRKLRHVQEDPPSIIDGNIKPEERFAEVYGKLYNSIDDKSEATRILEEIEVSITADSLSQVDKVTTDVIAEVIHEIKPKKSDPIFLFNSTCIKHAPKSLHMHLVNMIKCFLIHGHISDTLLIATIVPLIKDKLGDMENSDNYRSIALSSVLLKIFDWVIMNLYGKVLGLDELQFSYQKNCSTTMCTWLVVESINHFNRNGSDVFTCFMDMKKAFDTVKHSLLFRKLIDRKLPPIFIRLLLHMYTNQTAKVRWQGKMSKPLTILNGVKQGAVLSAILFCIYIDDLIKKLRKKGDGCWINQRYVGIAVYADDIVLLSPSQDGLQNMINECSDYAKKHHLTFSTNVNPVKSKTKCMAFLRKTRKLRSIKLNNEILPWISKIKHLGSTIVNDINCDMIQDLLEKRATYIARNSEINQEFSYAHPNTKIWLNNVYNSSFYGAPLWSLFSRDFEKLEKSWNVSQRMMLQLPRETHRFFLEPLSKTEHIIKSIRRRFDGFLTGIRQSYKEVLRHVLRTIEHDCRSTTGRNIRKLRLLQIDSTQENHPYMPIPEKDRWKVQFAEELTGVMSGGLAVCILSKNEIKEIVQFICCA